LQGVKPTAVPKATGIAYLNEEGQGIVTGVAHTVALIDGIDLEVGVTDPAAGVHKVQGPNSLAVHDAAIGDGVRTDLRYIHGGYFEV